MDQRSLNDRQVSEETQTCRVGSSLVLLRKMFGKHVPTYAALYEAGEKPDKATRDKAQADYLALLEALKPRVVVILPTPSKSAKQDNVIEGTACWRALKPPDALDAMRGTFWEQALGRYVVPLFWPYPGVGQLNLWFMNRWIRAAVGVVKYGWAPDALKAPLIYPSQNMADALYEMTQGPVAIDIETIPNTETLTAIGISDGRHAVSIPFDGFQPSCGSDYSPELNKWTWGHGVLKALRCALASPHAKILQNGVFDLPILRKRGFEINGTEHDTLAMHAVAYPEARHGLQLACATELIVPPWKSLFKPQGLKREQPEFWFWSPDPMRSYNAEDAYYTYRLAQSLAPKVEVTL